MIFVAVLGNKNEKTLEMLKVKKKKIIIQQPNNEIPEEIERNKHHKIK